MIPVLDKGFIRLVEKMGTDSSIVEAARVSYAGISKGPEKDKKLLFYLMEHKHMSPFEQVTFKFHVKAPIFVARQWFRHRIGSFNEISARYTEVKDEFYSPGIFRAQDTKNKQGSVPAQLNHLSCKMILDAANVDSYLRYKYLLEAGVAREMARMVLPVNMYTEWYWVVNVRSLLNFINLRADVHAQEEIRQYADILGKILKDECPWTFEAFMKYEWKGTSNSLEKI